MSPHEAQHAKGGNDNEQLYRKTCIVGVEIFALVLMREIFLSHFLREYNWSTSQDDFGDDEEKDYEYAVKQRILGASLQHVHECGWTNEALEAGS